MSQALYDGLWIAYWACLIGYFLAESQGRLPRWLPDSRRWGAKVAVAGWIVLVVLGFWP